MKKSKSLYLHIIIVSVVINILLTSCNSRPGISIDTSALNDQKDSIRSFTIHNTGAGKLLILDYVSSCECTALNLKKGDVIPPKDSLKVEVKINSTQQEGGNMIAVTIKTNATPQLSSFQFRP